MAEFKRASLRKIFEDAGIEIPPKDVLGQICDLHTSGLDDINDTIKDLNEKLAKAEHERDAAKASSDKDLQKKYDDLTEEFNTYKADVEKKETYAAKEKAYRDLLKDANLSAKGIEKAVKYAEWDNIELDADGKLKGANDHLKNVKEEWADYVSTTQTLTAGVENPPVNNGGAKLTKAEIYKKDEKGHYVMSASERQKALAQNPDLLN